VLAIAALSTSLLERVPENARALAAEWRVPESG
jgi:hypothetical protein